MAYRMFHVKSGKFLLRNEKGKFRFGPGDRFKAFDYQVPDACRDIVEALEELEPPIVQQEEQREETVPEQPKPQAKKALRQDKVEELRAFPLGDGKWDVINVVADRKVNDVPMTAEDVAKLIPGFAEE